MTVAEYIAKFLVKQKVKYVFGFQGSAMLKILDEIVQTNEITYLQNFHEQASSFAADSYARVTGTIGVALATSGPGAVNLVGGIADAYFDSIPVMFITGQDYSSNVLKDNGARQNGFQDLNIVSMVNTITKYAKMIVKPEEIAYELERAFEYAMQGRKGPVLLDIPIDIQFAEIDEAKLQHYKKEKNIQNNIKIDYDAVRELISESKKPVILAGGGIQLGTATNELKEFALKTQIPVIATLNGIDAYSGLYGFSGLYGHTYANIAIYKADLLIILGARLGQRQIGKIPEDYSKAKVIHVDVDQCELNRVLEEELSIQCGVKEFLTELIRKELSPDIREWNEYLRELKTRMYERVNINQKGLDPIWTVRHILSIPKSRVIVTGDVGQNQIWLAQGAELKENDRLLNSGGYGSMGYSLPAAIGAYYADKSATVISFNGDGGFHMNQQELLFLQIHRPNIKCVVFNNNCLGLMRETQHRYYNDHYYGNNNNEFSCVNLEKLALVYSIAYVKIERNEDIRLLDEVLQNEGPCLVECVLTVETSVINRYDEFEAIKEEDL